jgi:WD40 repeat protein
LRASDGVTLFQKSLPNPDNFLISNIAWSPDNRYFTFPDAATWSGGSSCSLGIWDRKTYQRIQSITVAAPASTSGTYSIRSIAWSLNGQKLAAIVYDTIYIIQLGGQRTVSALNARPDAADAINSFTWSPDEQYIAALIQQNLSVWSTSVNGQQISLNGNGYPPQTNNIVAFSWSTDSQSLTVADSQNNLWQWAIDNY